MIRAYAYSIMPIYPNPGGRPHEMLDDGTVIQFTCSSYLHYWVDENLQYHQKISARGVFPKIEWPAGSHITVTLVRPGEYTVNMNTHKQ